jgi:hypothetical protein
MRKVELIRRAPDVRAADLLDSALTENVPVTIAPPGVFTGADIGVPALSGSTVRFENGVTIQAGGGGKSGSTSFSIPCSPNSASTS